MKIKNRKSTSNKQHSKTIRTKPRPYNSKIQELKQNHRIILNVEQKTKANSLLQCDLVHEKEHIQIVFYVMKSK